MTKLKGNRPLDRDYFKYKDRLKKKGEKDVTPCCGKSLDRVSLNVNIKEDWKIINELSEVITDKKLFNNKVDLENSMLNYLNLFKEKNLSKKYLELTDLPFSNEKLIIKDQDYYYSNSIARASKTMSDCRNSKNHIKATGTEG